MRGRRMRKYDRWKKYTWNEKWSRTYDGKESEK